MVGPANSYSAESWWNRGGSGGYGYSLHFPQPAYQASLAAAGGRSIPDVSAQAGNGIQYCQAYKGASPNCSTIGGTSLATPLWAGIWALASQAQKLAHNSAVSAAGPYLYSLPQSSFQPASGMTAPNNDPAHLGLGSPNITRLVENVVGVAQITSLSPAAGPASGGTRVTISGHGFIGVLQVIIGGIPASNYTVQSESTILATTGAAATGLPYTFTLTQVITPAGTSANNALTFRYYPVITGVSPASGSRYGGTAVNVSGLGFGYTECFSFGGIPAVNVTCSSSRQCVMASPASSPGSVDIVETVAGSSPVPADRFTFLGTAITSVTPNVGSQRGGTLVDLLGTGLSAGMIVKFNGVNAGAFACLNDTWCWIYAPPGLGTVPVTATIDNITQPVAAAQFTYEPLPWGTLSPNTGPAAGGTVITVTGGNFSTAPGGTKFDFSVPLGADSPAAGVSCTSATTCRVTVPPCMYAVSCEINPYAVVSATVNGLSSVIANFNYGWPNPSPPSDPGSNPPKGGCTLHTCQ